MRNEDFERYSSNTHYSKQHASTSHVCQGVFLSDNVVPFSKTNLLAARKKIFKIFFQLSKVKIT